ncbi:D-glycero-alpha-D-manno-heptose-1,7-bisphosphate 7-phosphatase [Nannocystis pusilla]|uniref:D,D-heptose 1,7-bisphosphate phosphatase n=1 Tax=Nannocystis pusilla TaxID=889268 RepID=A0ABS7TRB2_9BACT|nr:HAD family hydrolase [Nannocystis pusilla]MBZ5710672.1 HAD family hydrolase [Nannocystis pusilla]
MTIANVGTRGPRPAIFLDKDGTLIDDVPYNVDPARVCLTRGAREGVTALQAAGYALVVVTNQSGVARGLFGGEALLIVRARIEALLGRRLDGFYWCPHYPAGVVREYAIACGCRKPQPGLLTRAAGELGLDLARSWMVGDILSDVEAGCRAGCRTALLGQPPDPLSLAPQYMPTLVAGDLAEAARRILGATGKSGERSALDDPRPAPRA